MKCVQKAKQLVSNALNSPSSLPPTQTPNLSSFSSSSHVHSQSISSVAPIRGNYVAISRSSSEWPTVVQAHGDPVNGQQPSSRHVENKTFSTGEYGADNKSRETRAHSAPDLQCSIKEQTDDEGQSAWSVDEKTLDPLVSSGTNDTLEAPSGVHNATTVSSATKARTKSYATTQDGSRLSYCEVATGIESVSSKGDDFAQVGLASCEDVVRQ